MRWRETILAVGLTLAAGSVVAAAALALNSARDEDDSTAPDRTEMTEIAGISASPRTGLVDDTEIDVVGRGLPPDMALTILPCGTRAIETGAYDACDRSTGVVATTDETGTFSASFPARTDILVEGGHHDCRPSNCLLSIIRSDDGSTELARFPLTFSPDVDTPILRPGNTTDLRHLDDVALRGSALPDARFTIVQCHGSVCAEPGTLTGLVTDGALDVSYPAARLLVDDDGTIIDCAVVTCTLHVTGDSGTRATIELGFDAAAALPAPTTMVAATNESGAIIITLVDLLGTWHHLEACTGRVACRPLIDHDILGPAASVDAVIDPAVAAAACGPAGACSIRLTTGAGVLINTPLPTG